MHPRLWYGRIVLKDLECKQVCPNQIMLCELCNEEGRSIDHTVDYSVRVMEGHTSLNVRTE